MNTKTRIALGLSVLSVFTGGVALAQSSQNSGEIKLSAAAQKILCERFPLNSRCSGSPSDSMAAPAASGTVISSEETPKPTGTEAAPKPMAAEEAPKPTGTEPVPSSTGAEEAPKPAGAEAVPGSPDSASSDKNIVEVASEAGAFKTLTAALKAADLTETLEGSGPFTVFAPTDEAFAALPAGTVDALLKPENKSKLVKVLTYHVLSKKAAAADLTSGDVPTVESSNVKISVSDSGVMVNDAKVIKPDVMASNGVIHVIDKVIVPPGL